MRHFIIIIAVVFLACLPAATQAQVRVGISFNLGIQPAWGPTGYDYVENYYMPDIDVYYNVPHRLYYFYEGGRWIGRGSLPSRYGTFDHYRAHKVVMNERDPWLRHDSHKGEFESFRNRQDQTPIRDSKDSKYFENRYHPEHDNWARQQREEKQNRGARDNGKRRDNGHDENHGNKGRDRDKENGKGGGQNEHGGGKGRH